MRFAIINLLILVCDFSIAQTFTATYITSADSTKTFLIVESKRRPDIAKKVNLVIQRDWSYDMNARDPFTSMADMEESNFVFEIGANNDRVFSIMVESSHAACGLHVTRYEYHFDSNTGARLDLNKIFAADGLLKLKKSLHKSFLNALNSIVNDPNESRSDEYKSCLANSGTTTEVEPTRFIIAEDGIRIWAGSCLEGTTYDFEADRSRGPHWYPWTKLLPMLTPYGFSLFIDKPAAPLRTLMHGTIDGKYPISLAILPGKESDAIKGCIVYERVGEPISIKGTIDGRKVKFNELDEMGNPLSDIEVNWDGTKLSGSFTNLKSKKKMPFSAAVVK